MTIEQGYIRRCFDLAKLGAGCVSPNPMVGAVLVYENRIIGEGWHQKYGGAHAEVNALKNVKEKDRHLIKNSTLYVSLEPCCFFGKTPACTNLIIEHNIPRVIISCLDSTEEVAGKGIEILKKAGVQVSIGVLEKEGQHLSRFRNTFVSEKRPFIILKYAKSEDGFFAKKNEQIWITNPLTKRIVHKWRSELDAILVGTKTAEIDNPQLTNRLYFGKSPIRIVFDRYLGIDNSLNLFDEKFETWVIYENDPNHILSPEKRNLKYFKIQFDDLFLKNVLNLLYEKKIMTLMVEGGIFTLQQFINQGLWDEARILKGKNHFQEGIKAPDVFGKIIDQHHLGADELTILQNIPHIR